jgi:hypothetical protein
MRQENDQNPLELPGREPQDDLDLGDKSSSEMHDRPGIRAREHGSAESGDSVRDEDQEGAGLDLATQQLLDRLDDELEAEVAPRSDETEALLSTLDKLKPQTVVRPTGEHDMPSVTGGRDSDEHLATPSRDVLQREAKDGVPDQLQEEPTSPTPDETPPVGTEIEAPPVYRYQVAVVLPRNLQTAIQAARDAFELGAAEAGLFQWQAAFRTDQPHAVAHALDEWATRRLPIKTQAVQVYSEVAGAQTYIAGWRLDNAETIHQAQNALTEALAALIEPEPDAPATFRAIVPVKIGMSPETLPRLVGYLQKDFDPHEWTIEAVELLRSVVSKGEAEPSEAAQWEATGVFKAGA